MFLDYVVTILVQSFSIVYAWLVQNLVNPFLAFTRGFEFAVIFASALLFLLISVFIVLRQAKKLPDHYVLEITDLYGNTVSVDGLRQVFATYDAAESYARLYRESFAGQYKFRVTGIQ